MKTILSLVLIKIILIISLFSCSNHSPKNDSASTEIEGSENVETKSNFHRDFTENFYVFADEITDSMISQIQNMKDPYLIYESVDKIFTSGKELSSENNYEKIFFRKLIDHSVIHLCVLYPDPYNDFIYEANWFAVGGNEKIISVFQHKNIGEPKIRNENLLIVISQDCDGNYFTDIFGDDCGMKYCGISRFYDVNDDYIDFFSDVKSVGDFRKKFPEYILLSDK